MSDVDPIRDQLLTRVSGDLPKSAATAPNV